MSLSEAQKIEIDAQSALLVELNEPEAWLEAIRRIADRQARTLAHGLMADESSAKRWKRLADAIASVQVEIDEKPQQTQPE